MSNNFKYTVYIWPYLHIFILSPHSLILIFTCTTDSFNTHQLICLSVLHSVLHHTASCCHSILSLTSWNKVKPPVCLILLKVTEPCWNNWSHLTLILLLYTQYFINEVLPIIIIIIIIISAEEESTPPLWNQLGLGTLDHVLITVTDWQQNISSSSECQAAFYYKFEIISVIISPTVCPW